MFGAVALINGNFGSTTPLALLHKVLEVWDGKGLEKLNIVPAHVLNALIFLAIALYVLRSARRWLEKNFLPKTMMEPGMRFSLVTLFSNVGYVLGSCWRCPPSAYSGIIWPGSSARCRWGSVLVCWRPREHEAIQSAPAPSVTFSQLTPLGIVLSVTGFVSSPRVVA
nr:hypothetical protein [Sodalis glossinidius]